MPQKQHPVALAGAHRAGTLVAGQRHGPDNTAASNALGEQRDLRFRHDVIRLHALGPRAVYELLAELGASRLLRTEIEQLVGCYADLDPDIVRAVGADKLPPLPPLRAVPRVRG
jgi:hypothetical protein